MQYVLIVHEVEDYKSWKKIFDEASEILKYESKPNNVVHF